MKIQNKIFLMIIGIIIPSFLLLILIIPTGIEKNLSSDILLKLKKYQDLSVVTINQNNLTDAGLRDKAKEIVDELSDMFGLRVSIYNNIRMMADSGNNYDEITPEIKYALKGRTAFTKDSHYLYYAFPVKDIGAIRFLYPLKTMNNIISQTVTWLIIVVIIIVILCLIAAVFVSGKISRPIVKLNREASRIKEGDYDLEIEVETDDEIGELTDSFIEMSREIRKKVNELEEMLRKEKELKNMQQNFLNSVTHEFKTPLTSIIGYSDLLEQYRNDGELLTEAARVIRKEGKRLYNMVEKVLYLSRMGRFDFEPEKTDINIKHLIEEAVDIISYRAREKGIRINTDISYRGIIKGDQNLLYRMFINLMDNAVKYNRNNGQISIFAESIEIDREISAKDSETFGGKTGLIGENTAKELLIRIEDTGIGISSEELGNIFEPFYREDKNRSRKIGGDGLGLSIVKEIVEKHKGQIEIKSKKGYGTSVLVRLPL